MDGDALDGRLRMVAIGGPAIAPLGVLPLHAADGLA